MKSIFQEWNSLEFLDISKFNTENVTNMECMFDCCSSLKGIKGIENLNTIKVTNMKSMFEGCKTLEYLNLSNFNTINVTDMKKMFAKCHKLKK